MTTDQPIELVEWNTLESSETAATTRVPDRMLAEITWLLRLPKELRLDIYEHILISASKPHWRISSQRHHFVCNIARYSPQRYNLTSLIFVYLTVYNEAAPILYRNNTFQYDLLGRNRGLPAPFNSPIFRSNLRHLTIIGRSRVLEGEIGLVDAHIGWHVNEVTDKCLLLRTCEVQIPTLKEARPGLNGRLRPRGIGTLRTLILTFLPILTIGLAVLLWMSVAAH